MTLKIALLVRRVRTYKLPPRAATIRIKNRKIVVLFPVTRKDSFLLWKQYNSWTVLTPIEDRSELITLFKQRLLSTGGQLIIQPSGNKFRALWLRREGPVRVMGHNHLRMSVVSFIGVTRVKVDLISYPRST
jgi:hypothetical protein